MPTCAPRLAHRPARPRPARARAGLRACRGVPPRAGLRSAACPPQRRSPAAPARRLP